MKKALVTGGYGFLGRHIAKKLNLEGYEVSGIGHGDWNFGEAELYGFSHWATANITLDNLLKLNNKFDLIIHCGGSGTVQLSLNEPFIDFEKTVLSTQAVLEYIYRSMPDCKLIYPSSAAVYGECLNERISETADRRPASPYGYHKKIAEELCEYYSRFFDLNISIIRFFSIYGIDLKKQILWDACNKLTQAESKVVFFGTGSETRDFIYIEDAVALIVKVSEHTKNLNIYNGGSGVFISVLDVVDKISHVLNSNKKVSFNDVVRSGDPLYFWADIKKANSIGWYPKFSFDEGLKKYIEWFFNEKS